MAKQPDLVAEYHSFDAANPLEPIKIGGAIRDPDNFDTAEHGKDTAKHGNLTAVICYYTPYMDTSGSPITISFALLGPI